MPQEILPKNLKDKLQVYKALRKEQLELAEIRFLLEEMPDITLQTEPRRK